MAEQLTERSSEMSSVTGLARTVNTARSYGTATMEATWQSS